jgi:hypothetical protein
MKIVFDMDGTIADLYAVENWEPRLRAEDASPYAEAVPMWDMEILNQLLEMLMAQGHEIIIVTWLSKNSTEEYKDAVREAKREWLAEQCFPYNRFHGVQYGATKADSIRKYMNPDEEAILIDDNAKVRNGWHLGRAIDPTDIDIIQFLESLLG